LCTAHAGAAASLFARWHEYLPESVEVWAIQLPGREERLLEPVVTRVDEVVDSIGPEVEELSEDVDLALFGNCLGSVVMYELARWLRTRGARDPKLFIASAHPGPTVMPPPHSPPVHTLPDDDIIRIVGNHGGISQELLDEPEMREIMAVSMRADAEMHETYQYVPDRPFRFDILAAGGTEDPDTSVEALKAWEQETTGNFDVRVFPGAHLYLRSWTSDLMRAISRALNC
jgi:medium-chain acyl-[acyl-carrier-protein] hydrolase